MAIDFDEMQTQKRSKPTAHGQAEPFDKAAPQPQQEDTSSIGRHALGEGRKKPNSQLIANLPQAEKKTSVETVAEKIVQAQKTLEAQTLQLKQQRRRLDQELDEIKKTQQDIAKIIGFFTDHQEAIHTSMYSTSKYVIEKESEKAVEELKKVAETAKKNIGAMEDQALKAVKKVTKKSKGEIIFRIIQLLLLILILLKLTYS